MKKVVLLCGVGRAGKTKTLKTFFRQDISKRLRPLQLLKRKLNGRIFYAVSLGSPQELSDFCDVKNVLALIKLRIEICEEASGGKDYSSIIPFGLYGASSGNLNKKCIVKPIDWLKAKGFKVSIIYLRKKTAYGLTILDSFMTKLTENVIESNEEYTRQANEFEKIIRN